MSLGDAMMKEGANAIMQYRKQTPFGTLDKFINFDVVKNSVIRNQTVTVQSQYFC